jgi:hypothetical protein
MLYKLMINYMRLKLIRLIIHRVMAPKTKSGKNLRTISLLTYCAELFATFYFGRKKKIKK